MVIRKILNHLQEKSSLNLGVRIHNPRAPSFEEESAEIGVKKEPNCVPILLRLQFMTEGKIDCNPEVAKLLQK